MMKIRYVPRGRTGDGAPQVEVTELQLGGRLHCLGCGLFLADFLKKRSYACPRCRDCFRHEEAYAEIQGLKEAIVAADLHRGIHV